VLGFAVLRSYSSFSNLSCNFERPINFSLRKDFQRKTCGACFVSDVCFTPCCDPFLCI
jgi:hypothetical protein